MNKKLRVILADDHAMVREGLRLLINGQPDMQVIAEAGDGSEVLRKAKELQPDLVVMDLTMPHLNGQQATELLKARESGIKVIALTVHEDSHYLRQLVKAGADGYVLKRSAGEQLIQAIHAVVGGGVYFDATLASRAFTDQQAVLADGDPHSVELSEQETKVLTMLAWGQSNKEIAGHLELSVKTIETYKARGTEKLKLRSRTELVQHAVRQGWLDGEQPPLWLPR